MTRNCPECGREITAFRGQSVAKGPRKPPGEREYRKDVRDCPHCDLDDYVDSFTNRLLARLLGRDTDQTNTRWENRW